MTYRTLIDEKTLHGNLSNDDWALVDCRFYLPEPDRGEREYLEAHVPGAVYAHLDRDLSGEMTGANGRHPLPSVDGMVKRFAGLGIDENIQVVAYDTAGGQVAARLWWMLRYLGHDAVAVLDGGLSSWVEAGLELERGRVERRRRSFAPRLRRELSVGATELEGRLLIDARAPERFRGETEPLDPVAGHIPGARNHPTTANLDGRGRFHPPEVLAERYESVIGNAPPEEVVSYCGSGVTACHNILAMEHAGSAGARLYPGSWSEWCADPRRPIAIGDEGS